MSLIESLNGIFYGPESYAARRYEVQAEVEAEVAAREQPVISRARKPLFAEIEAERQRQDAKWGEQNHRIREENAAAFYKASAENLKMMCNMQADTGRITWYDILMEEVYEAFAEDTPERQREELVQVAAVVVAMIECIDRRAALAKVKGE